MSTLTEFEPFVDKTMHTLFRKLDDFVSRNEVCDIAVWLQYCRSLSTTACFISLRHNAWSVLGLTSADAFDVIGELTFSKPLGFLEKGTDVDGIIAALEHMLDYSGKV